MSTHEAWLTVVCRSVMIAGMAMLTMVTSSSAMNMPKLTTIEDPPLARVALVGDGGSAGCGWDGVGH